MASSSAKDVPLPAGLTSDEARSRLEKFGPNAMPDTALHPLRRAAAKFWAPVRGAESRICPGALVRREFQVHDSE
jgi:Cation transporter/ATPase, N-terminus